MNVSAQNYAYMLGRHMRKQVALTAADDETSDNLLVLNTGDGARLLMEIYTDYVSEYDFTNFMKFMRDADKLLYNARGKKAFTHEERRAMEQAEPAPTTRKKRKKSRTTPTPSAAPVPPPSVTAMAHAILHHLAA